MNNTDRDFLELAGISHETKAFAGPDHVVIDITNHCNNNCIGCWTRSPLLQDKAPDEDWKNQFIPLDAFKRLLKSLKELGTKRLRFTGGGEPSLHPDFLTMVKMAKEEGFILAITTNFTRFDKNLINELLNVKVDNISISLWSGSAITYSRIHLNKTELTFEKIKENIRHLIQQRTSGKPEVLILNVLNNLNYHETKEMLELAFYTGVDGMYLTLLDPVRGKTDGLLISKSNQLKLVESINNLKGMVEEHIKKGHHFKLDNFDNFINRIKAPEMMNGNYDQPEIDKIPCYIGWHFCRILADGTIAPCCKGSNKPLGNIIKEDFKACWFSEKYNDFRLKALKTKKSDSYFCTFDCYGSCDNLMHNQAIDLRIKALTTEEKLFLKNFLESNK